MNNKNETNRPTSLWTVLRFSSTAWAKLLFLRDAGETEIGGFGIAPHDDLLFVEDVRLVKQCCTWISADFDDQSVADFFEDQADEGRQPQEFSGCSCTRIRAIRPSRAGPTKRRLRGCLAAPIGP